MKKISLVILFGISFLFGLAQNPPQKINANYQFQSVGGDSSVRLAKSRASNSNLIDTGMIWFNKSDLKIHWLYNLVSDTTFISIPVSVGAIDSLAGVANGLQVINNRLFMQTVNSFRLGIMQPLDWNHFQTTYKYFKNTSLGSNMIGYPDSATNVPTGIDNTIYGHQAGIKVSSGAHNVAIGGFSLNANTTGSDNTAVGYTALEGNTTSNGQNTAIGSQALRNDISGIQNTAVGYGSLTNCQGCTQNVGIGFLALNLNTSGSSNTAVGWSALQSCSTGAFNTAMGNLAENRATSGSQNTGFGYGANSSVTTGSGNTAVGYLAEDLGIHGSFNTSIGNSALGNDTLGTQNVAAGTFALSGSVGDTCAIAVGPRAGYGLGISVAQNRPYKRTIMIGDSVGFFTAGNGHFFLGDIFIGNKITLPSDLDTERYNSIVIGNDIQPDTDNIAIIGQNNQHIRLGNGGTNTAGINAVKQEKTDIVYNTDSNAYTISNPAANAYFKIGNRYSGSFSQTVSGISTFTVFIPQQPSTTYAVLITPTSSISAALLYVSAKTNTSFTVTYLAPLTGTVTFDFETAF